MEWTFERHAEAVDDHVRFLAKWDGKLRHVFVSAKLIDLIERRVLTRTEAEQWVEEHARELVQAAHGIEMEQQPGRSVIAIDRLGDLMRE